MSDAKKCPHPTCSCMLEKGQSYCSAYCKEVKDNAAPVCECGHQGCKGEALTT